MAGAVAGASQDGDAMIAITAFVRLTRCGGNHWASLYPRMTDAWLQSLWNIRRTVVRRFVSHDSERDGFLGVHIEPGFGVSRPEWCPSPSAACP